MDLTYTIGLLLERLGVGTLGTNIFVGQIPSEKNGIYISRSGGNLSGYSPVNQALVDIYVKDTSSKDCVERIESLKNKIHRLHNTNLNLAYLYSILVVNDVEGIQRDEEYAKIYKITLNVIYRDMLIS